MVTRTGTCVITQHIYEKIDNGMGADVPYPDIVGTRHRAG